MIYPGLQAVHNWRETSVTMAETIRITQDLQGLSVSYTARLTVSHPTRLLLVGCSTPASYGFVHYQLARAVDDLSKPVPTEVRHSLSEIVAESL